MKTFAQITGVILIGFGLLIIVCAVTLGAAGGSRDLLHLAGTLPMGRGAGIAGLLFILLIFGHGLLPTALGAAFACSPILPPGPIWPDGAGRRCGSPNAASLDRSRPCPGRSAPTGSGLLFPIEL